MSVRPRQSGLSVVATALAVMLSSDLSGIAELRDLCSAGQGPSFGMRYGSNPKRANGGRAKQCAANFQRAAKRRRNIAKHPRCRNHSP